VNIVDENLDIKKEVIKAVRLWKEKSDMSIYDIEIYCEDTCSLWNSLEELIEYFNEDGESITEEELKNARWCIELSNGEYMMMG
jgi:hypothetical protein